MQVRELIKTLMELPMGMEVKVLDTDENTFQEIVKIESTSHTYPNEAFIETIHE